MVSYIIHLDADEPESQTAILYVCTMNAQSRHTFAQLYIKLLSLHWNLECIIETYKILCYYITNCQNRVIS